MLSETRKINEVKFDEKDFSPLPSDKYTVEMVSVDEQKSLFPTEKTKDLPKEQQVFNDTFNFKFVVLDAHQRGQWLWATTPDVLYITPKNGKNKLYQIIEATIKRELTQEEVATMEGAKINKLIGRQLCVMTGIKDDGKKQSSKILSFLSCNSALTALTAEEKEKATKPRDEEPKVEQVKTFAPDNSEVRVEDIPF